MGEVDRVLARGKEGEGAGRREEVESLCGNGCKKWTEEMDAE